MVSIGFGTLATELQEQIIHESIVQDDAPCPTILLALANHALYVNARRIYRRFCSSITPSMECEPRAKCEMYMIRDLTMNISYDGDWKNPVIITMRNQRLRTMACAEFNNIVSLTLNLNFDDLIQSDISLLGPMSNWFEHVQDTAMRFLDASSRPARLIVNFNELECVITSSRGRNRYTLVTHYREMVYQISQQFGFRPWREVKGLRVSWVWEANGGFLLRTWPLCVEEESEFWAMMGLQIYHGEDEFWDRLATD